MTRPDTAARAAATPAGTTGRRHPLAFSAVTALFGHFGLELDLAALPEEELAALRDVVRFHRRHRALLHSGDVVRANHPDPEALVHGVVAPDNSEALFAYVQLGTSATEIPAVMRRPGWTRPDATGSPRRRPTP